MILNPWLLLTLCIAFAGATAGAYYQGREDGANKIEAQLSRENAIATKGIEAAASAAAVAISKIKVQHRTVQQEVQREISERVVYRECLHSPEQLQRINSALTGSKRPEPAGSGVLP